jgi:hypothetical protein
MTESRKKKKNSYHENTNQNMSGTVTLGEKAK